MLELVRRDRVGAERDKDSLLSNAELVAGAVSSILRDSDLKKMDAVPVEEALTLSLQGVISVSPSTFVCPSHRCFMLHIDSYHSRGAGINKIYILNPTAVAKLLQYSGSRVEHRDGFSSYKRFAAKSKTVNLVWF